MSHRLAAPLVEALHEPRQFLVVPVVVILALVAVTGGEGSTMTREMARHVAVMNVAAPLLAIALGRFDRRSRATGGQLAIATLAQLCALFAFHTPAVMMTAHAQPALQLVVQAILFAVALAYWVAVLDQIGAARWRAILALLVTGKLFCLLGAVLLFAPRALYAGGPGHPGHHTAAVLADQHLAGVLMLAACPATYVLGGVVIAARWVCELPGAER